MRSLVLKLFFLFGVVLILPESLFASVTITGVYPTTVQPGGLVSVSGTGLTVDGITFGSTVVGLSHITATGDAFFVFETPHIAPGAYSFCVSVAGVCVAAPEWIVLHTIAGMPAPTLTGIVPPVQEMDYYVTVRGKNFFTVTGLRFQNFWASDWQQLNDSTLRLKVPYLPAIGMYSLSVTSPFGTSNRIDLSVSGRNFPVLQSVHIQAGKSMAWIGDSIRLEGKNFHSVTGVAVGSVIILPGQFLDSTVSKLVVALPAGNYASLERLVVYTKRGVSNALPLAIRSDSIVLFDFSPTQGFPGDRIRFTGQNLHLVTFILIGSDTCRGLTVVDAGTLEVTLPNGLRSAKPILYGNNQIIQASDSLYVLEPLSNVASVTNYLIKNVLVTSAHATTEVFIEKWSNVLVLDAAGRILYVFKNSFATNRFMVPPLTAGVYFLYDSEIGWRKKLLAR